MLLETPVKTPATLVETNDFVHVYTADPAVLLCDEVITAAEQLPWVRSRVGADPNETEHNLRPVERDSCQQSYSAYAFPDVHHPILDFASDRLQDYLEAFPAANHFPRFQVDECYQVLRYLDGEAYHATHSDYHPFGNLRHRHLTGITFLNDVAVGGELLFPQQGFSVKPEAGKFLIFPSGWTHAHKTLPPVGQSRYVFQMWWTFIPDPDANGEQ